MSAYLLLDLFQQYVEMSSFFFFYPYVQPPQRTAVLGIELCYWIFSGPGGGVGCGGGEF